MAVWNLNNAEQSQPKGDLIPDKTVARAILTIRPGGAGDGGWLKLSRGGEQMIDAEFTIVSGPYAKRKVWNYMMVTGNETAVKITMSTLRAIVEGNGEILPTDQSPAAQAARNVLIDQLNGMECCVLIGVEPAKDGYEAKNKITAVIAPGQSRYLKRGEIPVETTPGGARSAPVAANSGWAAPQASAPAPAAPAAPAAAPATSAFGWAS